jgi:FkbM family methyltransferase
MQADLIFDVGMHSGLDTRFYLGKGFRVVAVEANPSLAENARTEFRADIDAGRLFIIEKAIAAHDGTVRFHVNVRNPEWSTISQNRADRNSSEGFGSETIEVPSVRLATLLERFGTPYYLKIDIEGADLVCLQQLAGRAEQPRYVSVECSAVDFEETFALLATLYSAGYRRFKLLNQDLNARIRLPSPPREGRYFDYRFVRGTSGPFGEETPGEWQGVQGLLDAYARAHRRQRLFKTNKYVRRLYRSLTRVTPLEPAGWYDIHATL